jgi:hypothetical protein
MTQDEIIEMAWDSGAYTHRITMWGFSLENLVIFADAVAAKAIAELESQEPWCMKMNGCKTKCEDCPEKVPQRTWVGLASEDRLTAKYMQDAPDGIEAVIDYIEAKLKEKNSA